MSQAIVGMLPHKAGGIAGKAWTRYGADTDTVFDGFRLKL
jgi:hypothetical protein